MSTSAWGIDHGMVSKAWADFDVRKPDNRPKNSVGRDVTATLLPGVHGLAAGKKGRKWRSAGNEVVGAVGGNTAGFVGSMGVAGATKGKVRLPGGMVGSTYGGIVGNRRNVRQGYLKPLKKRDNP
jgi:hypothetical protein